MKQPNKPERTWTEEEIIKAMREVMHTLGDELKIQSVIGRLKEMRD